MILKMNQVILASSTQTVVSLPHTDGQSVGDLTEELQSDAASHFVILPSAYCIMDTLPSGVTLAPSAVVSDLSFKKQKEVKKEKMQEGFLSSG